MEEDTRKHVYRVVSIDKAPAPEGMKGSWYRYVIQRGKSIIEGMQAGKLSDVQNHAESYANTLNERFVKGNYAYRAPKKNK